MTQPSIYLAPPHISAGFYLNHTSPREAFANICEQVTNAGANLAGYVQVVHAQEFPRFSMMSDLATRLESVQFDVRKHDQMERCKNLVQARDPLVQVLRTAFNVPRIGPALVEFQSIPEVAEEISLHPIGLTLSGALVSIPPQVSLDKREKRRARAVAQFLLGAFHMICEALDPLYGAINTEQNLATPAELIEGNARLGTEIFVSNRLSGPNARLWSELVSVFADGFSQQWTTGFFLSGWSVFNPEGRTVNKPVEVGTRAARLLGLALAKQQN